MLKIRCTDSLYRKKIVDGIPIVHYSLFLIVREQNLYFHSQIVSIRVQEVDIVMLKQIPKPSMYTIALRGILLAGYSNGFSP